MNALQHEVHRLKYAVEGCFNGVWGDEPNGTDDMTVVRVADFDRKTARVALSDNPTVRAIPPSARNRRVLARGDLLIEKSGGGEQQPVGNVVLFDSDVHAVCSNFVARLPVVATCDARFIAYAFQSLYAQARNIPHIKQTSGIQNLDSETYLNEPVWQPPFSKQVRIANFLDEQTARIDALIAEKERLLAALVELRTARIWSEVTGQVSTDRQLIPDTPWCPSAPKSWMVTPVGKFARLQRGFDLPDEARTAGAVPVMSGGGISGWHNVPRVKGPGVVTGRYGTIGVLHYVDRDYWPLNTSLFVYDFFGNSPKYAYYLLSFLPWDMLGGKAAVPGVNRNDVHPLLVGVPPRHEQDAIVFRLDAQFGEFDKLSAHAVEHIDRLHEYRSSLISAAVTGQLDTNTFEVAA